MVSFRLLDLIYFVSCVNVYFNVFRGNNDCLLDWIKIQVSIFPIDVFLKRLPPVFSFACDGRLRWAAEIGVVRFPGEI